MVVGSKACGATLGFFWNPQIWCRVGWSVDDKRLWLRDDGDLAARMSPLFWWYKVACIWWTKDGKIFPGFSGIGADGVVLLRRTIQLVSKWSSPLASMMIES